MVKKLILVAICLLCMQIGVCPQEDYLKIDTTISPHSIRQGEEGVLKLKITPRRDIKISSYVGFMIKLDDNENLSFPKEFFTANELDLQSRQVDDVVYLALDEKEIPIPFKVNKSSLMGKQKISGEIVFTAVFKDNWSMKTYQKFYVDFNSKRNRKLAKKKP